MFSVHPGPPITGRSPTLELWMYSSRVPLCIYEACPESILPRTLKIQTLIEEDTRYKKHCTQDNDISPLQSGPLGTSHSSPTV